MQRKASRGKSLQISYTLSNGLLQSARKLGQDASWINIMLTFRGNLQQLGPPSKKLNLMLVGHHGCTLYKLYAVPVRVYSAREDMHYP